MIKLWPYNFFYSDNYGIFEKHNQYRNYDIIDLLSSVGDQPTWISNALTRMARFTGFCICHPCPATIVLSYLINYINFVNLIMTKHESRKLWKLSEKYKDAKRVRLCIKKNNLPNHKNTSYCCKLLFQVISH